MRDAWHKAAIDGDGATVERLIADGVDLDGRDRHGQTALMLAARHGQEAVARILVRHGADLDATAKYGLSALMLAVINRHAAIAEHLVDAGANPLLRGAGAPGFAGLTARDLAEAGGLSDLAARIARAERPDPPGD